MPRAFLVDPVLHRPPIPGFVGVVPTVADPAELPEDPSERGRMSRLEAVAARIERGMTPAPALNCQARIRLALRSWRDAGAVEPKLRPVLLRRRKRGIRPLYETPLPVWATHTIGPKVTRWAARSIGLELLPWQADALAWALACGPDGTPAHRHVLISTGRQNGKTALVRALIGYATVGNHPGWRTVIGTAFDRRQAHRLYLDVLYDLEPIEGVYASAYAGIRGPRGRLYDVMSREARANARGLTVDLNVVDEVMTQTTDELWSALLPTMATRAYGLGVGLSSAGTGRSVLLRSWYELGRSIIAGGRDPGGFGMLWYGPPEQLADDDPAAIPYANPAYPALLTPAAVAYERVSLTLEAFRRERLNCWTVGETSIIPAWAWASLARPELTIPAEAGRIVLAVDAVSSWQRGTVTVAGWIPETERPHVAIAEELVAPGDRPSVPPSELIQAIARAVETWHPAAILFDRGAAVAPHLEGAAAIAGWPIVGLNAAQMAGASAQLEGLALGSELTHSGDVVLAAHLAAASRSLRGDTWRLSRRQSTGHIDAIVAAAMALYGLTRPDEAHVDLVPQIFL